MLYWLGEGILMEFEYHSCCLMEKWLISSKGLKKVVIHIIVGGLVLFRLRVEIQRQLLLSSRTYYLCHCWPQRSRKLLDKGVWRPWYMKMWYHVQQIGYYWLREDLDICQNFGWKTLKKAQKTQNATLKTLKSWLKNQNTPCYSRGPRRHKIIKNHKILILS